MFCGVHDEWRHCRERCPGETQQRFPAVNTLEGRESLTLHLLKPNAQRWWCWKVGLFWWVGESFIPPLTFCPSILSRVRMPWRYNGWKRREQPLPGISLTLILDKLQNVRTKNLSFINYTDFDISLQLHKWAKQPQDWCLEGELVPWAVCRLQSLQWGRSGCWNWEVRCWTN